MSPFSLPAPAKINLSIRVLHRRDDGFHEIDTTMVKLPGLADRIDFLEADTFAFRCDDSSIPGDESNLVVKAVRAFEKAIGTPCKYAITLNKNIPHGAGLGGGSSDAATTLLGLNQLHGGTFAAPRLREMAASLGSDIPFFLTSGAARCTGRGEIIKTVPCPPSLRILLLKPAFSVPTPDAYGRWSDSREIPGVHQAPQEIDGVILVNDLERPVFGKHRFLAELKQWLLDRHEITAALLCGSGSTVFAVLREDTDAEDLARRARHELDPGLWHWAGETDH